MRFLYVYCSTRERRVAPRFVKPVEEGNRLVLALVGADLTIRARSPSAFVPKSEGPYRLPLPCGHVCPHARGDHVDISYIVRDTSRGRADVVLDGDLL